MNPECEEWEQESQEEARTARNEANREWECERQVNGT